MRALILIATAALSLAACRNNGQADNTTNVDESLAAENIVSNDVTAIDAVTGADANMAADVNYVGVPDANDVTGMRPSNTTETKPAKKPTPTTRPPSATENTTAPATAVTNNATE